MPEIYENPEMDANEEVDADKPLNTPVLPPRQETKQVDVYNSYLRSKDFAPESLSESDYYPNANDNVNIGQFSGKYIGSLPQYAAGGALYPHAIVDARRRALERAALLQQLKPKPKKDSIKLPDAVDPRFDDYLFKDFEKGINDVKKRYNSEDEFYKDYSNKGKAFEDVQVIQRNAQVFKEGVNLIKEKYKEIKTGDEQGDYIPQEDRKIIEEVNNGIKLSDPEAQDKLKKYLSIQRTANTATPIINATNELSKNISEGYANVESQVAKGVITAQQGEDMKLKIASTSVKPQQISAMANLLYKASPAPFVNSLTTSEERKGKTDAEIASITTDKLTKTLRDNIQKTYKVDLTNIPKDSSNKFLYGRGAKQIREHFMAEQPLQLGDEGQRTYGVTERTLPLGDPNKPDKVITATPNVIYSLSENKPIEYKGEVKIQPNQMEKIAVINETKGKMVKGTFATSEYAKANPENITYQWWVSGLGEDEEGKYTQRIKMPYTYVKGKMRDEFGFSENDLQEAEKGGSVVEKSSTTKTISSGEKSTGNKPRAKTVTQNGQTYTLNEATGKYE